MSNPLLPAVSSEGCTSNTLQQWRQWHDLHRDVDARIRDIYSNRAPWAALATAQQQKLRAVYTTLKDDLLAGSAWQRLLNHLGRNSSFLSVEPVVAYLGPQPGNTFMDALLMLALRHEQWLNGPETYRTSGVTPRAEFAGPL